MTFAGTGFTPKRECATCFFLIITMEFVQKESDRINKNMNKKCVLMKYDVLGIDTETTAAPGRTHISGSRKLQLQSHCKFRETALYC